MKQMQQVPEYIRHELTLITGQFLREYHKHCADKDKESTIMDYTAFCYKHRLWRRLEQLEAQTVDNCRATV